MGKKVLMTWGGWNGHTPEQSTSLIGNGLKEKGYEVEIHDTLSVFNDGEKLKTYDLIVPCWTMSQIEGEQSQNLRNAILDGVGLAGWHGGMCDSFRNDTEYQFMTGGQWVVHPGNIIDYQVNISNVKDPITEGLSDFMMKSEQYYMHTDPGNEVLATTTFSNEHCDWIGGTVMPVVWKRPYGKGKVFYSSLGHVVSDFEVHEAKEIMLRGCEWAAK